MFRTACTSKVVRDVTRKPRSTASPVPRFVVIHDWTTIVVEHKRDELAGLALYSERPMPPTFQRLAGRSAWVRPFRAIEKRSQL
jgi:hypothetical protein